MIDKIDTNILDKAIEYVKIYNDYVILYNEYNDIFDAIDNREEVNKENLSEEKLDELIRDTDKLESMNETLKKEFEIKCNAYNKVKYLCMDEDLTELYVFMATSIINEEYENTDIYKKLIIEYTNFLYESYNDLD